MSAIWIDRIHIGKNLRDLQTIRLHIMVCKIIGYFLASISTMVPRLRWWETFPFECWFSKKKRWMCTSIPSLKLRVRPSKSMEGADKCILLWQFGPIFRGVHLLKSFTECLEGFPVKTSRSESIQFQKQHILDPSELSRFFSSAI